MNSIYQHLRTYQRSRPEYWQTLQVYGDIRYLQEMVMNFNQKITAPIKPELAQQRLLSGQALLRATTVGIEPDLFRTLAQDLPLVLPPTWPLHAEVEQFLVRSSLTAIPPEQVAARYLTDRAGLLAELVAETGVSRSAVAYVLHTLLGPFFEQAARTLQQFVADHLWSRGDCPICGSPPLMARLLAQGGQRQLVCGLCQTEWVYPRTGCPFCGEGRPDNLPQFHLEGNRAYRVDTCRTCHHYLKTVDERQLQREAWPAMEDIITAHLDILAQRQGFQ